MYTGKGNLGLGSRTSPVSDSGRCSWQQQRHSGLLVPSSDNGRQRLEAGQQSIQTYSDTGILYSTIYFVEAHPPASSVRQQAAGPESSCSCRFVAVGL